MTTLCVQPLPEYISGRVSSALGAVYYSTPAAQDVIRDMFIARVVGFGEGGDFNVK